jgi:polyisoprenoid-binding protein YceI
MSAVLPTTGTKTVWAIDTSHADVQFSARHMMMSSVKGNFTGLRGTIWLDESNLTDSSAEIEIETNSLTSRDPNRDTHLKSADFFDVENYPKITFKSTTITQTGSDEFKVAGDLTVKDVTRPVLLDTTFYGRAKTPFGTEIVSFSAETTINRKDFGLTWNVALETGGWLVGDKVKINIEFEAVMQDG